MATHVRKLLDQISDPSTKAAHSEICFKHAKDASRKAERIAPYAVTDTEAVTLERLGITTSPFATTSHTHAADKILENDCLELIGRYLPKDPTTLIQLKRSKLHLLGRGPNQDTFANYCHEPKDVLRYGLTNPHSCPRVTTEYAVLADTLHFMSTSQLITLFMRNPKLQRLFATLVLPIEALHRLPSLFPEIYRLEYYANHFAYMPGGHGGGAYVHAYSTLKWLSTGQIGTHTNNYLSVGISDYLSIEKIETKAAHHVMLIQRRRQGVEWPLSPVWVFHASEYVKLPHIFYPPEANVQKTYSRELIMRLQAYCLAVKAVSLRDIFAKLRLVIETRELQRYSTADLIRLANYLLFTTGMQTVSDYESLLTKGFVAKLGARIRMRVRTMLEGIRGQSSYAALLSVTELIPVHFTTQPVRRPAQGQQWFQETEEESPTDDSDEDWLPKPPLLEDLELLADLEKRASSSPDTRLESGGPNLTPEQPPNGCSPELLPNGCPGPEESTEHLFDDASLFTPEELEPHAPATKPLTEKPAGKRPLSPIQEVDEIEAALKDDGYERGQASNSTSRKIGQDSGITIGGIVCPEHLDRRTSKSKAKHEPDPALTHHLRIAATTPEEQHVAQETTHHSSQLPARTIELLKLHGFTALQPQFDGEAIIEPIYHNPNTITLPKSRLPNEPLYRPLNDLAAHLQRRFYQYNVDNKRATAYMSDVKNNLTGLVLPRLNRDVLAAWLSLCETAERQVHLLVIHGAGGAGKSRALQELLRAQPTLAEETNIVVPTVNLVMDWKRKMPEMDPKRFMTFEKACEREGKEIVIFDDYGKLPAGYVDAYIAIKPTTTVVILTGDQRQSVYHTSNRDAQTAMLNDNVAHFKRFCDYYINATHRQPRRLANPIKVHAERQTGGSVARANLIKDNDTVLVPAHRTQTALTDLGRSALTYSGCQGLTLPNVTIVLDGDTPLCSNEVLYTAFSRASESITFVNTHSDNPEFLAKLDSTPYLKTLLTGVREDEHAGEDYKPPEPTAPEPSVKTHLPVTNPDNFLDDKIESMDDKDVREIWVEDEKTNLMQTENPIIQLFPHQQAKDEALFKLTIDQRIRKASPQDNAKAVASSLKSGDLLFEAYADFMKVPKEPQEFDRDLWLHCKQLAQRTYLSKPKTNLVQGAARQDPDFPANAIALFNKSQWVKKLDKVGFPFKAGQTISAFKQTTVLLTTTMALYLRKKREAHQPENVFIMCERTPSQFNDFVTERWDFSGPSYTSDYTQYDQSQDAPFLNFELRKAAHLGVPSEVLQFYKFIKMNAKTFVGNLAVMRLSGEGPTFDANTECNIAYDALRFQLNDKVNACYAGDDLVRDQVCPERSSWTYSQHLFSLTAKPLSTNRPDFCGWRLTPHGIVKSPLQLYQSLMLAIQLGKTEDVKRSYAVDYMYAYTLGDRLYEIFDEKELEAHQLTTRILIKKGMRVPHSGEHLPTFHVTSDRLIKNPHYKEMHDAEGSRMYLTAPTIREDHMI